MNNEVRQRRAGAGARRSAAHLTPVSFPALLFLFALGALPVLGDRYVDSRFH
jgi:hypothetical protein